MPAVRVLWGRISPRPSETTIEKQPPPRDALFAGFEELPILRRPIEEALGPELPAKLSNGHKSEDDDSEDAQGNQDLTDHATVHSGQGNRCTTRTKSDRGPWISRLRSYETASFGPHLLRLNKLPVFVKRGALKRQSDQSGAKPGSRIRLFPRRLEIASISSAFSSKSNT